MKRGMRNADSYSSQWTRWERKRTERDDSPVAGDSAGSDEAAVRMERCISEL